MLNHLKKTVLIASASAALIVGATSSAATAQPVDPNETAATPADCAMYFQWYYDEISQAFDAWLVGDSHTQNQKLVDAEYTYDLAVRRGCDVSKWRVVANRFPTIGVPVGPGQLTTR
jgi:hypothetical protein